MISSPTIQNLAKALSEFQAEIKNPANTANNPFFSSKYAPLSDILNLVRPILGKYGLSVVQMPSGDGQNIIVTTVLLHSSGEWIESEPLTLKADKPTAQGAGSGITYARRYALSAILGISSEDDDDGNVATHGSNKPEPKPAKPAKPAKKELSSELQKAITDLQFATQKAKVSFGDTKKMAEENFGQTDLTMLTEPQIRELITIIGG